MLSFRSGKKSFGQEQKEVIRARLDICLRLRLPGVVNR